MKDKKVLKYYDMARVNSRIKKNYGSIKEEEYQHLLVVLEHYFYMIYDENTITDKNLERALEMCMYDILGYIEAKEYDYTELIDDEIAKIKEKLEATQQKRANKFLR